jgi:hypothetical protein
MRAGGGPFVVCVIGKKKSGKTTTTVGLIRELARRGHRVMSAKHGHGFELDAEGTDSWRHRHEGGAHRVAMAGPEQVAVLGGWDGGGEQPLEALVQPLYGRDPEGDGRYLAILTDVTDFAAHVPVMDLGDDARFARLADLIESNLSREDR